MCCKLWANLGQHSNQLLHVTYLDSDLKANQKQILAIYLTIINLNIYVTKNVFLYSNIPPTQPTNQQWQFHWD